MANFEPAELEWERAPRLAEALINFIHEDGGARFLGYDFAKVFDPENNNPVDIRGAKNMYMALSHNDFEAVYRAIETQNPQIIEHLENALDVIGQSYPDFKLDADDAMTAARDSLLQQRLSEFVDNNIAAIENGELDPADYIGNLSDYIDQGIYSKSFIQQAFGHEGNKFTNFLRGLGDDALNSALDSLFEKLWGASPEFIADNNLSEDSAPVIPSAEDTPPVIMSAPEMPLPPDDPVMETGDDIILPEDRTTPPPPPPPGAAALEGLIKPNISSAPTLRLGQAIGMVEDIEERLQNLPDDPDALQTELRDIANDLKEIAIALNPDIAADPRFTTLPPVSTNPDNIDAELHQLIEGVGAAADQETHAELTELLIQNSQQASIAARAIDYLTPPEAEVEAEAEAIIEPEPEPEPEVVLEVEDVPDISEAAPEENGNAVSPPLIDYSNIVRPDSIDPDNAATYGIPSNSIASPSLVEEPDTLNPVAPEPEISLIRPPLRPDALFKENSENIGVLPTDVIRPLAPPELGETAQDDVQPDNDATRTRLSELLDGRGYHNDTDGYTDYDAMQDAFKRAAELSVTTEGVEAIRQVLNSPDFILKTSAAIEALGAYNDVLGRDGNEADGLRAFFNALAPEDFVRDREGVKDDNSIYDRAERDATVQETLRIENNIIPKL